MAAPDAPPLPSGLRARLSAMMFLQYGIWGAWLPFLWSFLSEHRGMPGERIGDMFAAGAIGAILGPFIAGHVADRLFATERFLAVSHLAGAALVWQLATIESYAGFLVFSLLYGLVYSPTLALTNSLAFHHLPDRDRDFGRVRLWGTFGWIAVGIAMGHWLALRHSPAGLEPQALHLAQVAGKADAFRLSAILGACMGLYCLFLPHTPPSRRRASYATAEALREVGRQPLLTLFALAVPVSCIHQFYFVHTEAFLHAQQMQVPDAVRRLLGVGGGGVMTIGQMVEVAVLGLIPLVAKRVSRKSLLAVGLLAYGLRMALFAYGQGSGLALLAGVALHGLCFGCFIFVAFMIVDEETSSDVRASAQNLFNLVIIGVGIIVGSKLAGAVAEWSRDAGGAMDYQRLFQVPMLASVACLLLLLAFYPRRRSALAGVPAGG